MRLHADGRATRHSISRVPALALLAGLLALAGCGSSSSSSSSTAAPATTATPATSATPTTSSGAAQTLALSANPEGQLKYNTTSLTAKAGSVSIDFTNSSPVGHNVNIESSSGSVVGATPTFQGGSKTLTVSLKAGTYKFFCSVPGHRMAGMEGTLTVK